MTYRGHIHNGQIALDEPAKLPEGAKVNVELIDIASKVSRKPSRDPNRWRRFRPLQMPGGPLSDDVIRDRR